MLAADRVDLVIKIATQTGIPAELFSGWQGHELALYPDSGGQGATLEIAHRQSQVKAARGSWTLDLGNRAVGLPKEQGAAFQQRLEEAGIPFETRSQGGAYVRRIAQVSSANVDLIRELAKR
jgi:hypothetical protein